jgi:CheY-like chemotaxis protein
MSSDGRVLWVDNDPGQIHGFVVALRRAGFEVIVTPSVAAAEKYVAAERFALVILDVMIPVNDAEEADGYSGDVTDDGHKTGLAFYVRNKQRLERDGALMVFTVRVDKPIRDDFLAAGLPPQNFVTKLELRDAKALVAAVRKRTTRTV